MKQISIIFAVILLTAFGLTGFTSITETNSVEAKEKWYAFSSATGNFSIKFPAKPELSETKKEDATTYKASAKMGQSVYFVGFTVHNTKMVDHQGMAQISLDAFAETLGGGISEQSDWKYKKSMGRQAVINLEKQDARVDYQVILIGQIQYQLVVVAPNSDYDAKTAKKFFKGFKMKK